MRFNAHFTFCLGLHFTMETSKIETLKHLSKIFQDIFLQIVDVFSEIVRNKYFYTGMVFDPNQSGCTQTHPRIDCANSKVSTSVLLPRRDPSAGFCIQGLFG